jgi:hypothetical protein
MRRALVLLALVAIAGCSGVPADAGLAAEMMVSGAQFTAGPMPAASGGPAVVSLDVQSNAAHAGEIDDPLRAALGPTATAAAIGLGGDQGYWIVPAGLPSVTAPGFPTFDVTLSFSLALPAGTYELAVEAVDEQNRFGDANTATLTVAAAPVPAGALVFTLRWDTESDLDIHVVDPLGNEIYSGDVSPAGSGGVLDFDSNASCVIDGRRQEDVTWKDTPPSGQYLVRVDTFSLCAATFANWVVEARLDGAIVGTASGESVETDTEMPHDRGAGVLALTLDVP